MVGWWKLRNPVTGEVLGQKPGLAFSGCVTLGKAPHPWETCFLTCRAQRIWPLQGPRRLGSLPRSVGSSSSRCCLPEAFLSVDTVLRCHSATSQLRGHLPLPFLS